MDLHKVDIRDGRIHLDGFPLSGIRFYSLSQSDPDVATLTVKMDVFVKDESSYKKPDN